MKKQNEKVSPMAAVFWNVVLFYVFTVIGCVITGRKPGDLPVIGWFFDAVSNLFLWVSWGIFVGYFGFIAICVIAMILSAARGRL